MIVRLIMYFWLSGITLLSVWDFNLWLSPMAQPSAYQELIAFSGGGLIFVGALMLRKNSLQFPLQSALFLLLALLVAVQSRMLPYAYSVQPLLGVLYFLWAALLSWAAWQWREELGAECFYRQVAIALLAGSLLAALVGLWAAWVAANGSISIVQAQGLFENGVLSGPLRQRNLYTTLLLTGLVCLAWLVGESRFRWLVLFFGGLLLALPLGLTGSRTGLLVCGLLAALAAGGRLYPGCGKQAAFCLNLLLLAGLVLLCQLGVPVLSKALGGEGVSALARLAGEQAAADSTRLRFEAWQRAWQIFVEHPLWGVGFNNLASPDFLLRAGPFAHHLQLSIFFTHSHNLLLQVLAELGLIGGILLLLLCWQAFLGLVRQWREPFGLFCVAVLVPLAVHSLLEYPLWYAFFLGPWILLVQGDKVWLLDGRYLRSFRLVAVLCVAGLVFLGWSLVGGIREMDRVGDLLIKGDKAGAYRRAWSLAQTNGLVAPYAERVITMLALPGERDVENRQILQTVDRVMRWKPYPLAPYKYAIWLMADGQEEKAYAMLKMALTVYPEEAKTFPEFLNQANSRSFRDGREWLRVKFEEFRRASPEVKR